MITLLFHVGETARDSDLGTPTVVLHWHLQSFVSLILIAD